MMQFYVSNLEGLFKIDAQFDITIEFDAFNCITAGRIPDQSVDQDLPTGHIRGGITSARAES